MFCPNCGTQNDSAATPCKKCGFKLSSVSLPKFKGTMMLNSDQTVQELIDEHRRKQAQGAAAEKSKGRTSDPAPKRVAGSSAPPSSLGGPRGPVLAPPRAAPPTRGRMGGTMMGVAPQAGGHLPPHRGQTKPVPAVPGAGVPGDDAPAAPVQPPPAAPATKPAATPQPVVIQSKAPTPDDTGGGSAEFETAAPDASPTDPLAGTVELPSIEPPPATDLAAAEETADAAAPARPKPVARTRPMAAVEGASSDAPEPAPAPAPAEQRALETQPPRQRAVTPTVLLPVQPEPAPAGASTRPPSTLLTSAPGSIRPLDVVLIVCTLGVYGVVLWFRQRKQRAA